MLLTEEEAHYSNVLLWQLPVSCFLFRVCRTRRSSTLSPIRSAGSESSVGKGSSERFGKTGLWFWGEISCSSVRRRWVTGGRSLQVTDTCQSAVSWLIIGSLLERISYLTAVTSFNYRRGNEVMLHIMWETHSVVTETAEWDTTCLSAGVFLLCDVISPG